MTWEFEDESPQAQGQSEWEFETPDNDFEQNNEPSPAEVGHKGTPEQNEVVAEEAGIFENFGKALAMQSQLQAGGGPKGAKNVLEFGKGALKGATIGVSGYIPGFEPEKESGFAKAGEVYGEIAPIAGLLNVFGKGATSLAMKSPVLQKQLTSLLNILGVGAAGATLEAGKELAQGRMPDAEDLIDHGVEWSLLDAGLRALGAGGQVAGRLLKWSESTGKPSWEVLNDALIEAKNSGVNINTEDRVTAKVMSILEREPQPLLKTAEQEARMIPVKKIEMGLPQIAEPYKPQEFTMKSVIQDTDKEILNAEMDTVGRRAINSNQFGSNVKQDIEAGFEAAERVYKPQYDRARALAEEIMTTPRNSANDAIALRQRIERLETRPEGYNKVLDTIDTALVDMGYTIERNAKGAITNLIPKAGGVSTDKLMELGRRLNQIVTYGDVDRTVKDTLKPLIQQIKQDVRVALEVSPEAKAAYENAEKLFGDTAQIYGKDSIRRIRRGQNLDRISNLVKSPSNLRDLRPAMSANQYKEVEREVLEHIDNLGYDKSRSYLRDVRNEISPEAQRVAENIVQRKAPVIKNQTPIQKASRIVQDDLANSFATGNRPERTLKLWKTEKGQGIIKNILKDSPQGKETLKYLKDQSFFDFTSSFVKDNGELDFKKFNELIKDPATKENIRLLGGEDAVRFFESFERYSNRVEHNVRYLDKLKPFELKSGKIPASEKGSRSLSRVAANELPTKHWLDWAESFLGTSSKSILGLLGILKAGTVEGLAAVSTYNLLYQLASKKQARNAFRSLSQNEIRRHPAEAFALFESFDED